MRKARIGIFMALIGCAGVAAGTLIGKANTTFGKPAASSCPKDPREERFYVDNSSAAAKLYVCTAFGWKGVALK